MKFTEAEDKAMDAEFEPAKLPPLTRAKLLTGMKIFGLCQVDEDTFFHDWYEWCDAHGAELLALSLAAIDRIEPRRKLDRYQKHTYGPAQQKVIDALQGGPKSIGQLATLTGLHDRNMRKNLVALTARGVLVDGKDPYSEVKLWGLPGCAFPTLPAPPSKPAAAAPALQEQPKPAGGAGARQEAEALPVVSVTEPTLAPDPEPQKPAETTRAAPIAKTPTIPPEPAEKPAETARPTMPPKSSPGRTRSPHFVSNQRTRPKRKAIEEPTKPTTVASVPAWMQKPLKPPGKVRSA